MGLADTVGAVGWRCGSQLVTADQAALGPHVQLLQRFGQQVHATAEDFRDPAFQCSQSKQVHAGCGFELDNQINIATWLAFPRETDPNGDG